MATPTSHASPARARQLREVGTAFLRARPIIVAPTAIATLVVLWSSPTPLRQRIGMTVGLAAMLTFFVVERVRGRRALFSARALERSLMVTLLGLTLGVWLTGGAASPLFPLMLAPTGIAFAAFGAGAPSRRIGAVLLVALVLLSGAPSPFPPLSAVAARTLGALALGTAAVLLGVGVTRLSAAYGEVGDVAVRAGEDAVAAAETRLRALESLGAQVAHEIKNPLAAVRGLVELVSESAQDARSLERLTVVRSEVARIETILRDYLSFSRPLESLEPAPFEVATLVAELASTLDARAQQAGVRLSFGREPHTAHGDRRRIKEALLNVLLNAVAASPPATDIRVTWSARADGGTDICVRDQGAGMDRETLARIGEAFFTTRPDGTGLGVRLARRVAEQHGGRLTFESAPGQGTCATLTLPPVQP